MRGIRAGWGLACALCVVSLAACGDDDDDRAVDDPVGGTSTDEAPAAPDDADVSTDDVPAGDDDTAGYLYIGELADGSELRIRLHVPADHAAVAPFEEYRVFTGAEEPTWIIGEITVPEGVDGTGRFVTFVEEGADRLDDDPADPSDGVTNSWFACSVIEDWFQAAEPKDQELSDAYTELYEGPCGGQAHQVLAPGGQTTTYVMVYEGELPDFARIESELGNELAPA